MVLVLGIAAATDPRKIGVALTVAYFLDGALLAFTQLADARNASAGEKAAMVILFVVARLVPAIGVYFGIRKLVKQQRFESTWWGAILLGWALSAYVSVVSGL